MNIDEIRKYYLTTPQAAKILNLSRRQINWLCSENRFEGAGKIDDMWLIPRESVKNYTRKKRGAKSNAEIQALINEAVSKALAEKEKEAKRKTKTIQADQSQQLELF